MTMSPPKPKKPDPMPDENDPAIMAARKRQLEMAATRSGRASTMLSENYTNDRLGG